jgi:hypothetical protein
VENPATLLSLADLTLKLFLPPNLRLRLLLPSIALIVAATMIPTALRHPSLSFVEYTFEPGDFFNNILLYMPLGIALSGLSLLRAVLCGLSLATTAELLQIGYIDRIPSPLDIASNALGTLVGYLAAVVWLRATGYDPQSLRIPRPIAAAAILVAIGGAIILVRHPPPSDFSNWNDTYELVAGNEVIGGRPWVGNISEFQIYPFAMASPEISDLAHQFAASENAGPPVEFPAGGLLPPLDLKTSYAHPLLTRSQDRKLYDELVRQNKLTLLVSFRTNDLEQAGPARIITYSHNVFTRNFTLGQIRNTLTFRLRTPSSGWNGSDPAIYTGAVLSPDHTAFVAAVYDGRISRLYVDGKSVAQADLGAKRPHLSRRILSWLPRSIPVRGIELGGSEGFLSGLLALGIFALCGVPRSPWMRLGAGALAGAAIGGFIWIFGISELLLAIRIVLECIGAGMVIAASIETRLEDATV